VRRTVYALIITILALFTVLPGYVVTGEVSNGSQSAIVTVIARPAIAPPPPTPPPPVYGGGERIILPPPAPLPPGTTDVSDLVTPAGVFTQRVILNSADGMSQLIFDEGVLGLTEDRNPLSEISIIPMEDPPPPPEDYYIIGQVYDFGPDGVTFDPLITITFTYDESLIPEGVAEENLVIARWDAASGQWVLLEVFIIAPEINIITALVSHFTPFAILAYPRPPAFAAFAASDLLIIPTEVDIGETVDIIILVANIGGQSGSYELTLIVNGVVEASKEVTLAAGGSELVSFSTIKDTAGTYSLGVAGLTGSFTVGGKPVAPPSLPPPTVTIPITPPPSNLPIIGGIIAAVLLAMAGLIYSFLIHRRYKYAAITYPEEVERPVAPPPPKPISYPAVIGKGTATLAAAIVRRVRFLVNDIVRDTVTVATEIVGRVRILVSKWEVIGRSTVTLAATIVRRVRLLVSKWKSKKSG